MKKRIGCLLLTVLALLCASSLAADTSTKGISPKILSLLATDGLDQYVEDYVYLDWVEAPKGVYLGHEFVLVSKDGVHHQLYHYTNSETDENADQGWTLKAVYQDIAPQGKGTLEMRRHNSSDQYGQGVSLYKDNQGFIIYRIDPEYEEYWMQGINLHAIGGTFQVVSWFDRNAAGQMECYIQNSKIHFYQWDTEKYVGNVPLYTTFGLSTSFKSLPKSYQEAKKTFTAPPTIPGGTLQAERINFTSGKKYAVYSGPGENYLRGGNGKASVSTNDWIQVFGKENGWIMIQYDITSDHMRIGWIPEKSLPKNAKVNEFDFEDITAYVCINCSLTDDPLFSQNELAALKENTEVHMLATMGDWVYVEINNIENSKPVRGFVEARNLRHLDANAAQEIARSGLLASNPVAEGVPVTKESLRTFTVTSEYDIDAFQWKVTFNSGRDYDFLIMVDDRTETIKLVQGENG